MDYSTVNGVARAEFTEKKSEFIGYIAHAAEEEEAAAIINKIRAENRKATHNVYAYILRSGCTSRYSDDGEPQGTAGVPVLEVLKKEGLTDICCVVTRYFGGILLGGGGLVRAYSHAAKIAVDASQRMIMCEAERICIKTDYNLYGKISYILPEFEVKIINENFSENVSLDIIVKIASADMLCKKITDVTNGKAEIVIVNKTFADFA